MNLIKKFCTENNIITDTEGALFLEGCGLILSFMYEFGFSYTEEDFQYVKALHDGTSPKMDSWNGSRSEHEWISSLQSIMNFPTYPVLIDYKLKLEAFMQDMVAAI